MEVSPFVGKPGTIFLNTRLFFETSFKPFFFRSYTLSKHHSLYLKDAKDVVIFNHLPYMTTISRQYGSFHQPFESEHHYKSTCWVKQGRRYPVRHEIWTYKVRVYP